MKRNIFISAVSIFFFFLILAFNTIHVLPIGSDLPRGDAALRDVSDHFVTMKGLKKKNGLLVMFTCNTCPYVMKNQQRTKAVCTYALKNDIGVILLNANEGERSAGDSFEAMKSYAKQQGYEWPYAVDKDNILADEFGAKRTPECYLFNRDLKLVYQGAIDDSPGDENNVSRHHLKEAITNAIQGKDITVKETRSVGCGIKRKG